MKPPRNYPVWLAACMLLGPFLMVGLAGFMSQRLGWLLQVVGALMVMLALFFLSKTLHEQIEEVATLRQLLNSRDDVNRAGPTN